MINEENYNKIISKNLKRLAYEHEKSQADIARDLGIKKEAEHTPRPYEKHLHAGMFFFMLWPASRALPASPVYRRVRLLQAGTSFPML